MRRLENEVIKNILQLNKEGLLQAPPFLPDNTFYQVVMGSFAYGVTEEYSDVDLYGFCIPPKEMIFPHLAGEIQGFGLHKKRFDCYQQHHIDDKSSGKKYDISIYSIVRYFHLCMENNPNMIDSLFVPRHCIIHSTNIGELVRENRKLFLHKGAWHKFKGYSYAQMHKMKNKNPEGKRAETVAKYGYDVKFAYHVVRLLGEVEQILLEGDLTLDRKDRAEQMKSVRRGEWSQDKIVSYFESKEMDLEKLYLNSNLQHSPNEDAIKDLLLNCLEHHYGSISKAVTREDEYKIAVMKIKDIIEEVRQ